MIEFFPNLALWSKLFPIGLSHPSGFMPHGTCYLWKPELVILHSASDLLTGFAYYSIPAMLIYFVRKREDLPFPWIFWMFGAFIIFCGTTHLAEVWTLWYPSYWLSGALKLATAGISLYTAIELFPLIPKALELPSPAQLEATNRKLEQEISERKQAEAALQNSEARLRSIFEAAAIGITVTDNQGILLTANPAFRKILGYSEKQLTQMRFSDLTHPEDREVNWELFQELFTGKRELYHIEKRFLRNTQEIVWANLTVSLLRDPDNQPQFAIAMIEDITERKKTEKALLQYHQHLEELVGARTTELTLANEQLSWQASHDSLTGLVNRNEFEKQLQDAILSCKSLQQSHSLLYLDLDRFKIVNDTCGHIAGDELLRQVSNILANNCRKSDLLARLGGDEFALLLYNSTLEGGESIAQNILEKIQEFRFVWQNQSFTIGVSIGLVLIDCISFNVEEVINAADAACYAAKSYGRNRIYIYQKNDKDLSQAKADIRWVKQIERAIIENKFQLYIQQIACLQKSSLANEDHYEVLLRLSDETGKIVSPMAFIPAAERYNLMGLIDRWVIGNFFAYLAQYSAKLLSQEKKLASIYTINLSGESINDDRLVEFLKQQFQIYQIPPQLICFEITETVAVSNLTKARQMIQEISKLGCCFALDDFGSGMSSFGYLKYLPVKYLKIDGQFIKDIVNDPLDRAIVEAINNIGHVVGMKTIGEFVSDENILQIIGELGVDYAQGYAVSKPHPLWEIED
ncbi:EAL domain-containing protein [Oscillatoria salina]|uniref:EAL domain-containing protein n=1 Tax=Oscillatoria salina TaxID=331517 RepID=UPI0013BDE682|nr:EAL domain-containing protein [Oscillatoria salina]MBZ8182004.1 EAL domain-containing protein [Oscillatoria salina IIICB1]NET89387.1 EAL domain-containing protein [Kamptonema sp. SIO1D9]